MNNKNTKTYWDYRFDHDWEKMQGKEQTAFFADIAVRLMPAWLTEDIKDRKMSICDFGCAGGQAVDVLHHVFATEVSGVDFSDRAVSLAGKTYPDYQFYVGDIVTGQMADSQMAAFCTDVGYTSNVLEHLEHPWAAAQNIAKYVKNYLLILIPFHETLAIEEHCNIFDLYDIPLHIADFTLVFVNHMDCTRIPKSLYGGTQLFLVYANKKACKNRRTAGDLMGAFDHTYQQIFQADKQEIKKLTEQKEKLEIQNNRLKTEQQYSKHMMQKAMHRIAAMQSGNIYRMSLFVKRTMLQCVYTHDRRDFLEWLLCRIMKKDTSAKRLNQFDDLEYVKSCLKQAAAQDGIADVMQTDAVRLKTTDHIVIFASVPYYDVGGGQRSAQLARSFNALGCQVHYIYGFPCTEKNVPDMLIPANEHRMIDEVDEEWFRLLMNGHTIVIFEIPYAKFEPYLDLAKKAGAFTVYEHIDNWDTSLGTMFYEAHVFERFLNKADLLTVTAKKLGEKVRESCSREYLYLPNAVDSEIFNPCKKYRCPKDLKKGRQTLLYFGSLWGEWFDWEKIDYIAAKCPDCEIHLIGDPSGCRSRVKRKRKNVHFLGLKKQTQLPAYLAYTDIALLPFKNSEIGSYVSPLKIFEYIAMHVRVLATNLDDIQKYPNVFCSDEKEQWAAYIKSSKKKLSDPSVFISQNNWFARCEAILNKAGVRCKAAYSISVIVLNYNNRQVISRCLNTLLAHNGRYQYEVIVVDNGSRDGSYEWLKKTYNEKIRLLRNTKNGCSSGRNLAAAHAKGKYLCFLDSDQWVLNSYWMDQALQILEGQPDIGAVAWNAGWFAPGKIKGPIVDYMPNRAISSGKVWYRTDIAYLATSGFVMKHELFDQIGCFDEFYDPTCFEDTDLSLKIRHAGYELAYCPYMSIMHLPHQTTHAGSLKHTKLMERNGKYFKEKWEKEDPRLLQYYVQDQELCYER